MERSSRLVDRIRRRQNAVRRIISEDRDLDIFEVDRASRPPPSLPRPLNRRAKRRDGDRRQGFNRDRQNNNNRNGGFRNNRTNTPKEGGAQ